MTEARARLLVAPPDQILAVAMPEHKLQSGVFPVINM